MLSRFAKYAWGVLAYNILVILWGAVVRATGSGAGCGAHWPRCNGEIIPLNPTIETVIEFGHRLTSGLALLAVVVLVIWSFRAYEKGDIVRWGAIGTMFLMIVESLIGAALVLLRLVAFNESLERGVIGGLHLVNTFLLLGAITLTAWWASGGTAPKLRGQGALPWLFGIGLGGALLLGASGAIAALGNTLFPVDTLAEGIQQDFSAASHLFVQLRVFHPVIAVVVGAYSVAIGWLAAQQRPGPATRFAAQALTGLFCLQFVVGMVNLLLLAPIAMQLIHLLLADLVWIALVLCANVALAREQQPAHVLRQVSA